MTSLVVAGTVSALLIALFYMHVYRRISVSLPPGPVPRFLIGNLRDIPTGKEPWLEYRRMGETYGPVLSLRALGRHIVVLNSIDAATALLEKEGAIYSSRPRFPMIGELMGWGWNLIYLPYGDRFLAQRRILQQTLLPSVVAARYQPIIRQQVKKLVVDIARIPKDYALHLHSYTVEIILLVAYGHTISGHNDTLLQIAHDIDMIQDELGYSPFLVDLLPVLKYVPSWFPGASFKRLAHRWRSSPDRARNLPYAMVKQQLDTGAAAPCIATMLLEDPKLSGPQEQELIKDSIGVIYSAASGTMIASLTTFILAMMLHPEVQKKAQNELDRVTGGMRLPEFNDRSDLPYLDCILKETLRWHPVAPLGVPHATTKESTYNGHYIPPDTMVLSNIWAMLHDPGNYDNPERFYPERFLDGSVLDPTRAVFGFGRRICPGRHLADATLWMAAASLLAAFSISAPAGVVPRARFRSGIVSAPEPFECDIRPRSLAVLGEATLRA